MADTENTQPAEALVEQVKQMEAVIKAQQEELATLRGAEKKTARINLLFRPSIAARIKAVFKEKGYRSMNDYMEALVLKDMQEE